MPNNDLPRTVDEQPISAPASDAPQGTTAPDEEISAEATTGLDLPGYELCERLGGGGMGDVYRAGDPALGRDLAVKVMKADLQGYAAAEQRFLREARVTGSLQHPGIVPIYNLGRLSDGRLHYTMRLVRGCTFADILKEEAEQPEHLPALLTIFEKMCQAVAYAHSKRVIHRDLKPANVMVGRFGEVQVMDWGLARLLTVKDDPAAAEGAVDEDGTRIHTEATETPPELTRLGREMGTPSYMPPEQALGEWDTVDERADVFALGAILCQILTGRPPYSGSDVLRKAKRGDVADALARLDGCGADAALLGLCRDCLMPAREGRPRDAEQVAQRVAAYQAEVQERLRRAELERAAAVVEARWERKRRHWIGAAFMLLLAGAAVSAWLAVRATKAESRALKLAVAEGEAREAESQQRIKAEEQKRQTEQQAAIALAVNEFLQEDLLGQADISQQIVGPREQRDPDVKVRTLLDRAAQSIEGKFKEQPITEAAIRLTIGNVYRALGEFVESQRHLERSLQLRTSQLGADHPDTLNSKSALAWLYGIQRKFDQFEPLLREVLGARTAKLGADHPDTLHTKKNLAMMYQAQSKYGLAEPLLKEVLQLITAKLGVDHPDSLHIKNNLVQLHQAQDKYVLAEPLLKEVLQASKAKLGADHPETLRTMALLSLNLLRQKGHAQAEPILRECLAIRDKKQAGMWTTFETSSMLGEALTGQKKYAEAEPLLVQGYEGMKQRQDKIPFAHRQLRLSEALERMVRLYETTGQKDKAAVWQKKLDEAKDARKKAKL